MKIGEEPICTEQLSPNPEVCLLSTKTTDEVLTRSNPHSLLGLEGTEKVHPSPRMIWTTGHMFLRKIINYSPV